MIHSHVLELKLTCAAAVGIAAGALDAGRDIPARGWEDMGLKGLLIFAVIFVGKLFLDAQRTHKTEMQTTWDAHKKDAQEREEMLLAALKANSKGLEELTALTKEQTDYFKTVTRVVVSEKLGRPPPAA